MDASITSIHWCQFTAKTAADIFKCQYSGCYALALSQIF